MANIDQGYENFLLRLPKTLLKQIRDDAQQNYRTVTGEILRVLIQHYSKMGVTQK